MRSNGRAFQPIHLWLRLARDTRATTVVEAAVPAAIPSSSQGDTPAATEIFPVGKRTSSLGSFSRHPWCPKKFS